MESLDGGLCVLALVTVEICVLALVTVERRLGDELGRCQVQGLEASWNEPDGADCTLGVSLA
jgi:hypothetical protein